jgi:hypothetical protein
MSEMAKPEFFKKLQPSQFHRSPMVSKILLVIIKGNAILRNDKMTLLPYKVQVFVSLATGP